MENDLECGTQELKQIVQIRNLEIKEHKKNNPGNHQKVVAPSKEEKRVNIKIDLPESEQEFDKILRL